MLLVGAALSLALHGAAHASLIPVNLSPTTTLGAETSNNTSAASNFPGWSDGDEVAANVSKVNIHTHDSMRKIIIFNHAKKIKVPSPSRRK